IALLCSSLFVRTAQRKHCAANSRYSLGDIGTERTLQLLRQSGERSASSLHGDQIHAASLSAPEISLSVAFSPSLTGTPPKPRNPPSVDASATCWLIWRSQPLKAAASPDALASTTAPACRSVSMHLALISPGLLPVSSFLRPSRVMLRPSAVSKSATTALINSFDPGSILALTSAEPLAKLSFRRPQSPLGSAAVTAIPAIITLSRRSFHSSGVKFDLSVMGDTPLRAPLFV